MSVLFAGHLFKDISVGIVRVQPHMVFCQPLWACKESDQYSVSQAGDYYTAVIWQECREIDIILEKLRLATPHPASVSPFWRYIFQDGAHRFSLDLAAFMVFADTFDINLHYENASPYPYWIKYNATPKDMHRIDLALGLRCLGISPWQTKISHGVRVLMFRTEDDRALARLCL